MSDNQISQRSYPLFGLGDIWGVGRKLVERLAVVGIRTGCDLAQADLKRIRRQFSVTLERTALELRCISCIEMNGFHEPRQRIMTNRSLGKLTDDLGEIRETMRQHGQRGAEKLRRTGISKTHPFRQDLPQYSPSMAVVLPRPTDDSREILHAPVTLYSAFILVAICTRKAA